MNLFLNPSLSSLSSLIANAHDFNNSYNIIVDFDGEVLLRPASTSMEELNKFKFYFNGIHGKKHEGIYAARDLKFLNQVYKNLMFCWENDLNGQIDFQKITNIQLNFYWLEMKKSAIQPESITAPPIFFSQISRQSFTRLK